MFKVYVTKTFAQYDSMDHTTIDAQRREDRKNILIHESTGDAIDDFIARSKRQLPNHHAVLEDMRGRNEGACYRLFKTGSQSTLKRDYMTFSVDIDEAFIRQRLIDDLREDLAVDDSESWDHDDDIDDIDTENTDDEDDIG